MQSRHKISAKKEALRKVKQNGDALSMVDSKLKSDILFAWDIYRIQSQMNDDLRKKYITRFMIQESLKLFASLAAVAVSGFIMTGVFVLPIPFLVAVTIGLLLAAISGFYALYKIGLYTSIFIVHVNIKASSTTITENQVRGVDRLQPLPDDTLLEVGKYITESEMQQLAIVSKIMHSIFHPPKVPVLNKFLQCVAFGKQDKVEQLFKIFRDVYSGHSAKIQEALRYQGVFTDYSGRTFNCTAYEYAYWAKDAHMCRMLESHMDEETKAQILAYITTNDENGLPYQQNGTERRSAHFDLTPLKIALKDYIEGSDTWSAQGNWYAAIGALRAIGIFQRDVPAHVAQEYCRVVRSFYPRPEFNEVSLPRELTFFNCKTVCEENWFPLKDSNTGPGFDFTLCRAWSNTRARGEPGRIDADIVSQDLLAVSHLDEVRTAELTQLLEHLNPLALSPRLLG